MDSRKYSKGPRNKVPQKVENETEYPQKTSFSSRKSRRFRIEKWSKFRTVSSDKFKEPSKMSEHNGNSKNISSSNSDSDQEDVWDLLETQVDSSKLDLESPDLNLDNIPLPPSVTEATDKSKINFKYKSSKMPSRKILVTAPDNDLASNQFDPSAQLVDSSQIKTTGTSIRKWSNTMLGESFVSGSKKLESNEFTFTLISYNILSDKLMKLHPELYVGKCDQELDWDLRWVRLLDEILSLDCHVLCLQEVDCEHFESHYVPELDKHGYKGIYKKRTNDKNDGCAIFYKEDQLELVDWTSVEYFQPGVDSLDRDNIGILAKFRPKKKAFSNSSVFCVATTHLLFNPKRHDVKLAQVALLLAELDRFAFYGNRTSRQHFPARPEYYPCVLTGDFNLKPDSPVYSFLESGNFSYVGMSKALQTFGPGHRLGNFLIPPELGVTDYCQHVDVVHDRALSVPTRIYHSQHTNSASLRQPPDAAKAARAIQNGSSENSKSNIRRPLPKNSEEYFGSGALYHAFGFRSTYKHFHGTQAVTSNTANGYGTVDYILYSTVSSMFNGKMIEGNLKLLSRLNLLSGAKVESLGGLPSLAFPSDHLCLVAKFLLRGTRKRK